MRTYADQRLLDDTIRFVHLFGFVAVAKNEELALSRASSALGLHVRPEGLAFVEPYDVIAVRNVGPFFDDRRCDQQIGDLAIEPERGNQKMGGFPYIAPEFQTLKWKPNIFQNQHHELKTRKIVQVVKNC